MNPPLPEHEPASERLKLLELKAQAIRARLIRAVDALDHRRHQLARARSYAKQVAKPLALSTLGLVALCGLGALAVGRALRGRRMLRLPSRMSHALRELDLVRPPPLGSRIFERIAVTLLTFALTELVKRSVKNLADGRLPDGRLIVGRALADHHHRLASGSPT